MSTPKSPYVLTHTNISSRNKTTGITFNLSPSVNHQYNIQQDFRQVFKRDFEQGKIRDEFGDSEVEPLGKVYKLFGLFYWDNIPVYDIYIFLDEDTLEITHISAKLFTFMGNKYLSDLEGIRSLCKSFGDPVDTVPPYNKGNTISSHFINAKKEYTKQENCVYISLEILDGPPTNLRIIEEVFPIELRKETSRSLLPLSCSLFKQIYKHCDAVPSEFGSNIISYYKIDNLTFLGNFPVQEIRFHASGKYCDYIEIFLKDKDCYTFEEVHSIITSVFKENGINWTDTDNKRFICTNGELVFIDEDNIITIKAK